MKTSNLALSKGLLFCLSFFTLPLFSQTISFTNPSELSVCDSAQFSLVILNEESFTLTNGQLTLDLGSCMSYSQGSITGATENDISNLSQPVFDLPELAPDQSVSVNIIQRAGCDCVDQINNAVPFTNDIAVTYSNGSADLTTSLYEVETPLLVITAVTNTYLSGTKGDFLQRSFTLRNTRFGPLSSFVMMDTYEPGIQVSSNQGLVVEDSPGYFELLLTGADFQQIGDGDAFFEIDETIVITEIIEITDCGTSINSALSQIEFAWGCFNLICQDELQTAIVSIQPFEPDPVLEFTPFTTVPYCFCGPDGHLHGMTITNTGDGPALDVTVDLRRSALGEGMDINSFVVDSAGSMSPIVAFGIGEAPFDADCVAPNPVYATANFTLPILGPGESVFVHWNVYFCKKNCNSPLSFWEYKYRFFRECPENVATSQDEYIAVFKSGQPLLSNVYFDEDCEVLIDGSLCTNEYVVEHDTLDNTDGSLLIDFVLPCGFLWETTSAPQLAGVNPSIYEVIPGVTETSIHLEYPLPLPVDSAGFSFDISFHCDLLCDTLAIVFDSITTTCPVWETCNPLVEPDVFFDVTTTLQICEPFAAECAHQNCQRVFHPFECEAQDTNYIGSSGYFYFRNEARRVNYGLADNDNDQFPDPGGILDLGLVEQKRFIPGDTIESKISGIIIADESGASFDQAVFDLFFIPINVSPDINADLLSTDGIEFLEADLRVFDFSSGTYYNCPIPASTNSFANLSSVHHVFEVNMDELSCGLPGGFELAHADSLELTVLCRFGANPIQEDPGSSLPPLIQMSVTSTSQVFSEDAATSSLLCGCTSDLIELSGYEYLITNGVFVVPPCDTSNFLGANFISFSLAAPNLFPFEYRWGAVVENLELQIADGFELVESRVSRVQWQNGVPFKVNEPIGADPTPEGWYIQLDSCQVPPMDEGFSVLMQHRFLRDCHFDGAYPLITFSEISFWPGLIEDTNPLIISDTSNSLRALNPDLNLTSPIIQYISADNKFRWELDIVNDINSIASQNSDIAYNVWLSPESPSGLVSDFILEDLDNGTTIPLVNGLFQLGDFDPEEARNLRLIGLNAGCGLDTVFMHYGWNCTELEDLADDPCFQRALLLEGLSPDGELELQVFSPTDTCFALCDTVPYHTIEIFNANLGAICDIQLTAYIPSGFQVLPGSCQMAYPTGSPFVAIPDPVDLGSGQYLWAFDTFSDSLLQNCLSGVSFEPSNSVQLRFLGITDCDFPINSELLFVVEGLQTCDLPGNSLLRESDPFCIEIDAPNGEAFFNASMQENLVCEDEGILEVAVLLDVESVPGDSVEVILPPGILYVPGSYLPITNAPLGPPQIGFYGVSQVLKWGLDAGIPAVAVVSFQVNISGFLDQDCGEVLALFRATRQTNAFCAASGEECTVDYELGSAFLQIPIDRPAYSISAFSINASPSGNDLLVSYQVQVNNSGAASIQDLNLQFLLDTDGNGAPSGPDQQVFVELVPDFPGSGMFTGSFLIPAESLCQLLVWIDPDVHCACSGAFAFATDPIDLFPGDDALICSDELLEIGWCPDDFQTSWSPSNQLNCTDCCPAIFQYENAGQTTQPFSLTQFLTNDSDCEIQAHYQISVLPKPGILFADTIICQGESANLLATSGAIYNWTGPGITNPGLQAQVVSPLVSSWYYLAMEDLNACTALDSVFIQVAGLPIANAGPDTLLCQGNSLQLSGLVDPGWTYQWSPPAIFDNPGIPNPILLTQVDTLIVLTVTNAAGCTSVDTLLVDFQANPTFTGPEDLFLCLGLSDTLTLDGGEYYNWSPAVDCLDPACATVSISPTADITYEVTAYNNFGCSSADTFQVTVIDESLVLNEAQAICAGESADIFGELINTAGVYCDTIELSAGCLQITCIDLSVNEAVSINLENTICPGDSIAFGNSILTDPGTYQTNLQTWQGCDSLVSMALSWYESASLSIEPGDIGIYAGGISLLEVLGGGLGYSYEWSNPELLSCGDCPNPTTLPIYADQEFFVTITDPNGCQQILSVRIDITTDCEALATRIPNVFSPNGDGVNDRFEVPGGSFVPGGIELQIWNRWGELVLRDVSNNPFWDGTQNGEPVPQDVYVYRIFVECSNEEMVELTGEVQVIR
ncbi:MAG: gliding motility-associated C-terminal domain-containing protein [Saprospiraceae bacterium]|nr:gliding motility-associated C-terminal domain-containing protein [Saprospiraceae bacterium]